MARMRNSDPVAEDELLKGVPGMENDDLVNNVDTDDQGDDQQDDGVDDQQQQQQRQEVDDTVDEPEIDPKTGKPVVDPNDPANKQPAKYDAHGNVIDAKGNIIAPSGKYRRIEETSKRLKSLLDDSTKQVVQLRGQLAEREFLNGAPTKLGLTHEETAIGLDLFALFKRNPEEAVTTILAEAAARGVDLGKVLGNQNAVNTQAITAMLDRRLGPMDQERKQREQTTKIENEARERYNTFLTTYPDAETHQEAIATLMRDGKAKDETVAYFMLKEFATRNAFDFEQPLGPQIAAKMQNPNGRRQQQRQQQRPMPDGRNVGRQATAKSTAIASPDRSFASIIDEVFAENGIR